MISLYPHQEAFVDKIRLAFHSYKSVLAQAPCGFGKTVIASHLAHRVHQKGKRIIFVCHRKELLLQTSKTFKSEGIPHAIIAPGHFAGNSNVYIASMQTLVRRLGRYKADLLFVDECHMSRARGWSKVIGHYKSTGSWICGLTASPLRLDGKGLGEHFQTMVQGPTMRWMIDNSYLSKYRYFMPSMVNLSKVHTRMGDYANDEINKLMDKPSITGDAIEHWKKYAHGKRTLIYCTGIQHSQNTAAAFNAAGVVAKHVDGNSPDWQRSRALEDFADGRIKVITNCSLWTEGLDISSAIGRDVPIECIVLLRPTASLALAIQMWGRGLRKKYEPAIFLDHANIVSTHGLPDEPREWTLEGRESGAAAPQVHIRVCAVCFGANVGGAVVCAYCGAKFPDKPREINQVAGNLVEVDQAQLALKLKWKRQQGMAAGFKELVEVGKSRGIKNAYGWAAMVMKGREAKRARG